MRDDSMMMTHTIIPSDDQHSLPLGGILTAVLPYSGHLNILYACPRRW